MNDIDLSLIAHDLRACAKDDCNNCSWAPIMCKPTCEKTLARVALEAIEELRKEQDTVPAGLDNLHDFCIKTEDGKPVSLGKPIEFTLTGTLDRDEPEQHDAVSHPTHYNQGSIEVWDAIAAWGLDFLLGNVVKYVARAGHKGDAVEDLKKAREYIDKAIEVYEKDV